MVLRKSFRVWRKHTPRSVLLESKEIPDEALLFESATVARLCKAGAPTPETQNKALTLRSNVERELN